jgi:C4-dicarboxylate-specific signal transduction histidine kinase
MIYALHQNKLEIEKQQQTIFESAKLNSLGDMARGVAHEINSPLAAMILGAELIERRNSKLIPPDEKIGKYAQSIMDAGARVDTIVKGLKGFSRNASEDQLTTFTARHLIDMTLNLCGEMLKANNIEIIVKDKFLDTVINGSETLFSQCLYNLISNAFDAVTKLETRWVQISINLSEDKIEIRITDSGSGITPEIRQKMFSPMFTTRPIGKGPGLGLNISRSIMNNFGGNIIYDESCTNTCFVMELPHSA